MKELLDKLVETHREQKSKYARIECDGITFNLVKDALKNHLLREYMITSEKVNYEDQKDILIAYRGVTIIITPFSNKTTKAVEKIVEHKKKNDKIISWNNF